MDVLDFCGNHATFSVFFFFFLMHYNLVQLLPFCYSFLHSSDFLYTEESILTREHQASMAWTHWVDSGSGCSWGTGPDVSQSTHDNTCDTSDILHLAGCSGVRGMWWVWHSAREYLSPGPQSSWCRMCCEHQSRLDRSCHRLQNKKRL